MLGTDISYGVQISDEQLLREWQQGHEESLQALLERRYAPLLAHCARLVGVDAATALADDVFARLNQMTPAYRYPQAVSALLYRTAGELARQRAKEAGTADGTVGPGAVAAVLAPLSVAQREALSLCVGQGCSVEDVAAVLDEPADTVAHLVTTALAQLRDRLTPAATRGGEPEPVRLAR